MDMMDVKAVYTMITPQNKTEQNRTQQNTTEHNRTKQNQNRTKTEPKQNQNRTKQNKTEQNRTKRLFYFALFFCVSKRIGQVHDLGRRLEHPHPLACLHLSVQFVTSLVHQSAKSGSRVTCQGG